MDLQIISLIIALIAVFLGPLIAYKIAKKNLGFQFGSLIQEKWNDKLESAVNVFLDTTNRWIEKYPSLVKRGGKEVNTAHQINQEIDKMLDAINDSIIKLDLLLDSKISDQKIIIENVIKMKSIINSKVYDLNSIAELRESYTIIIEKAKAIFQYERRKIARIFR